MSSDVPSPTFDEALASDNREAVSQIIREADPPVLLSYIRPSIPDWVIGLLAERFDAIASLPDLAPLLSIPEAVLSPLIQAGMAIPQIREHPQVRQQFSLFVVNSLASTPSLTSVLRFLDLTALPLDRARALLSLNPGEDLRTLVGDQNFEALSGFSQEFQSRAPGRRAGDSEKGEGKDAAELPPTPDGPPDPHYVIEEAKIMPESLEFGRNNPTIRDLTNFQEVKVLSTSRFGNVRLFKRLADDGQWQWVVAKCYNLGDVRLPTAEFDEKFGPLVSVSHPNVIPILGIIPPTKTAGPIVITPYSPVGSLEDILRAVRDGKNIPPVWCDAGKIRMIVSLLSGLRFLHSRGIVHREVKPSDLIVLPDGTIQICGYLTSAFEEAKVTKASQVGPPTYMAPEIYDDRDDEARSHSPKIDVFSFALILYEILVGKKVFPSTLSAAGIMRRAMSREGFEPWRPDIPETLHPTLGEVIVGGWATELDERKSFDEIWEYFKTVDFSVFPEEYVQVEFHQVD